MVIFLLFIVGVFGLFIYSFSVVDIEIEKNLKSVKWLPKSATDISYLSQSGFSSVKVYECKISKQDFISFAEQEKWTLKTENNVELRYMLLFGAKMNIDYSKPVKNAFIYDKRFKNGGGTTVVYDKKEQKLYYSYNHN